MVSLDVSLTQYDDRIGPAFLRGMVNRVRTLPGVESASAAIDLPLDGGRFGMGGLKVPAVNLPPGRESLDADWNVVEPGYFRTLKHPLTRGRDFVETEVGGAPAVAIINEALAQLCWPGQIRSAADSSGGAWKGRRWSLSSASRRTPGSCR